MDCRLTASVCRAGEADANGFVKFNVDDTAEREGRPASKGAANKLTFAA
ncbi:hypothetical protein P6U16_09895 [Rhizobium sp. 32-5/1]|nr:hypothetical protein [Rhizobium sp. 32-5/1]WEZ84818.1 hypothetical protein P6U16_09895 [Rhizobium sp. 32-5/1]